MIERNWPAVPARPFTANGTAFGLIKVADTAGFYTKQEVILVATGRDPLELQVQEVVDPTTMYVGPKGPKVGRQYGANIAAYTVALSAQIFAVEQERKANPPDKDHYNAIYASDPIVADRVILVDKYGRYYDQVNPIPTIPGGTQITPPEYDEVNVAERNCRGDITKLEYKLANATKLTVTLEYDCQGNFKNLKSS